MLTRAHLHLYKSVYCSFFQLMSLGASGGAAGVFQWKIGQKSLPKSHFGTKLRLRVLTVILQPQLGALTRAQLLLLCLRQRELCLSVKFAHCDFYAQWRGRTRLKISCSAALERKYIHVKNSKVNNTSLLSA